MVKMPDLSELSKKINLQGMLDNVKSAINTVGTPGAKNLLEGDELVAKFSEITNLMKNVSDMHAQQAKAIAHVTSKIHELDKDIQAMKIFAATCAEAQKQAGMTAGEDSSTESTKHKVAKKIDK